MGISVGDIALGTTVANLGWDEVRFPVSVFHGGALRVQSEVLSLRESRSRPSQGSVVFQYRGYNQQGALVATCKRSALMLKTPA